MRESRSLTCLATTGAIALSALALGGCGGGGTTTSPAPPKTVADRTTASTPADPGELSNLQQSFATVISRVTPQVVQISNPRGLGSGIVFDGSGDIVTNAHVVAGGGPLDVTDSRGRSHHATLVGSFAPDDLAVVRASGASLPAATFAESGAVRVGDIVVAIGNPLGLRSSVTQGIVSALGRTVDEPGGAALPDVIQTSAPINPGNSGGALVNLEGHVIGIPTLAAADPELGGSAPGIGFAIPSSLVTDIATQLIQHGHVVASHRAFLGVDLATGLLSGAVVASVQRGGPAARAGIASGDVITEINGQRVSSPSDVADALATAKPGENVSVAIDKPDGWRATVQVTLGQLPSSDG
jgi:putative serine protease PepD